MAVPAIDFKKSVKLLVGADMGSSHEGMRMIRNGREHSFMDDMLAMIHAHDKRTIEQIRQEIKLDEGKLQEAMFTKRLRHCKIKNYGENTITHVAYQLAAVSKAMVHGHGMCVKYHGNHFKHYGMDDFLANDIDLVAMLKLFYKDNFGSMQYAHYNEDQNAVHQTVRALRHMDVHNLNLMVNAYVNVVQKRYDEEIAYQTLETAIRNTCGCNHDTWDRTIFEFINSNEYIRRALHEALLQMNKDVVYIEWCSEWKNMKLVVEHEWGPIFQLLDTTGNRGHVRLYRTANGNHQLVCKRLYDDHSQLVFAYLTHTDCMDLIVGKAFNEKIILDRFTYIASLGKDPHIRQLCEMSHSDEQALEADKIKMQEEFLRSEKEWYDLLPEQKELLHHEKNTTQKDWFVQLNGESLMLQSNPGILATGLHTLPTGWNYNFITDKKSTERNQYVVEDGLTNSKKEILDKDVYVREDHEGRIPQKITLVFEDELENLKKEWDKHRERRFSGSSQELIKKRKDEAQLAKTRYENLKKTFDSDVIQDYLFALYCYSRELIYLRKLHANYDSWHDFFFQNVHNTYRDLPEYERQCILEASLNDRLSDRAIFDFMHEYYDAKIEFLKKSDIAQATEQGPAGYEYRKDSCKARIEKIKSLRKMDFDNILETPWFAQYKDELADALRSGRVSRESLSEQLDWLNEIWEANNATWNERRRWKMNEIEKERWDTVLTRQKRLKVKVTEEDRQSAIEVTEEQHERQKREHPEVWAEIEKNWADRKQTTAVGRAKLEAMKREFNILVKSGLDLEKYREKRRRMELRYESNEINRQETYQEKAERKAFTERRQKERDLEQRSNANEENQQNVRFERDKDQRVIDNTKEQIRRLETENPDKFLNLEEKKLSEEEKKQIIQQSIAQKKEIIDAREKDKKTKENDLKDLEQEEREISKEQEAIETNEETRVKELIDEENKRQELNMQRRYKQDLEKMIKKQKQKKAIDDSTAKTEVAPPPPPTNLLPPKQLKHLNDTGGGGSSGQGRAMFHKKRSELYALEDEISDSDEDEELDPDQKRMRTAERQAKYTGPSGKGNAVAARNKQIRNRTNNAGHGKWNQNH